jgi:hypothetical protein
MSYVYKITNDINEKVYIGQTTRTIEERWEEHLYEVRSGRFVHRPLYAAMTKYGVDHFRIEQIEQTEEPKQRERYWIEIYGSFKDGYNDTLGGDGKPYLDYDVVIATYMHVQNMKDTADILGIHPDSVSNVLDARGIDHFSIGHIQTMKYGKIVSMFTKSGEFIRCFSSLHDAAKYMVDNQLTNCKPDTIRTHIAEVCNGKRKSAGGFIWRRGLQNYDIDNMKLSNVS